MGFMLSRLGRYVIFCVLGGILIALIAVLVSILLIDFVEEMRTVGARADLGPMEAARLTLLKTPMLIEQTLPFVVLAGSMMAIIGLNRRSELIAMRASGVSAWRFLTPPAFVGIVLGIITVTTLNPLGARFYQEFQANREVALADLERNSAPQHGVWIRQGNPNGQVVIHADRVGASGAQLLDATFMFFEMHDNTLRFTRRMQVGEAELRPGFWQLTNVVEASPG